MVNTNINEHFGKESRKPTHYQSQTVLNSKDEFLYGYENITSKTNSVYCYVCLESLNKNDSSNKYYEYIIKGLDKNGVSLERFLYVHNKSDCIENMEKILIETYNASFTKSLLFYNYHYPYPEKYKRI